MDNEVAAEIVNGQDSYQTWKQRGNQLHPQEETFDHVDEKYCLEIKRWLSSSYLSLSKDGNTMAIGYNLYDGPVRCYYTRSAIEVYVYAKESDQWKLRGLPLTDRGSRVSLSADGTFLAAGRYGEEGGMVNIFHYDNMIQDWISIGTIENQYIEGDLSDYYFGYSVALSDNGEVVAIGHPGKTGSTAYAYDDDWDASSPGLTHIYKHKGNGVWDPLGDVIRGEVGAKSGTQISLSADGMIVAVISVGSYYRYISPEEGAVYYINLDVEIHQYSEQRSAWEQMGLSIEEGIGTPHMIALSDSGKYITITFRLATNTFDFQVYKYDSNMNSWLNLSQDESWLIIDEVVVRIKDEEDGTINFRHHGSRDLAASANGNTIIVKEREPKDSIRVMDWTTSYGFTSSPTFISTMPSVPPSSKTVKSKKRNGKKSHKKHAGKKSSKNSSKKAIAKSSKKTAKNSQRK